MEVCALVDAYDDHCDYDDVYDDDALLAPLHYVSSSPLSSKHFWEYVVCIVNKGSMQ